MLSFAVYVDGVLAEKVNLAGAYVVGADDVPLRAEIAYKDGVVTCRKRATGPAALALLWDVAGVGSVLVETIRLPERDQPYLLQVELARARLLRIHQKLEDWGILDYAGIEDIGARVAAARDALIRALQADTPGEAAVRGDEALSLAVQAAEALSCYHAESFLSRRPPPPPAARRLFGCVVPLDRANETVRRRLVGFDFVTLPLIWRDIEPTEQTFNWKPLDAWVEMLAKSNLPVRGGPLLSFAERNVPDWLYIWEHDFDTIRDLAFEHVRRIINRYGQYVQTWEVIAGIHANNCFTFNFEQLMELTRMAVAVTKQLSPRSIAIVDIVAPWGEYYARNQRTIPPLLYADMASQSGIAFDAFGLQLFFGSAVDGKFVRDFFQISSMIDQFAKFGKPVHITAVQVPSGEGVKTDASTTTSASPDGGFWREPWSERIQAEWLRWFVEIALSKPFVESVSWSVLVDGAASPILTGGLLRADLQPKPAYEQWVKLRSELYGSGVQRAGRGSAA